MADQFDLEQGIMNAWMVTSDLDVLFEELVENDAFNKDKASNFVLGLSTIYEAKFEKLFRTFEEFLATYYKMDRELKRTRDELANLRWEIQQEEEANEELALAAEEAKPYELMSLEELFQEEEDNLRLALENEGVYLDDENEYIEDEGAWK